MITGSLVAIVTPMHADGSVDHDALKRLINFHVENGTDAIVSVGTTGESATLTVSEHEEVIRATVKNVKGRMPVIAGTGANSTAEAIELTQAGKAAGADACLLVVPYYNKPPQHGLYQHFKTIAEAVDIPQILYNVPGRTACDMLNETVLKLSDISNIVGLKDATADVPRGLELIKQLPDDFAVYSGEDWTSKELMLGGGKGTITVTANVAPKLVSEMAAAAIAGKSVEASELDARLQGLHKNLFIEANPIPSKWALKEMGLIGEGIRLPLMPLSEQYHDEVRAAMKQASIV